MRSCPSPIPAAALASGLIRACVVLPGWVMVVFTSPRLVVTDSPDGVIELHVDSSAEINPPLDSEVWTSSKQIAADLGKALYQEE